MIKIEFTNYIVETRLILIPVLYIVGFIIKNSELIKDKFIPIALLGISIIISILMGGDTIINNTIQGILVAGATVLGDQVAKQLLKDE